MSSTKRYNHYHIQIHFDNNRKLPVLKNTYINYLNNNQNLDTLIIFTDEIYLISSRSKIFNGNEILYNSSNSISKQVLKSLVYYYCTNFNKINRVTITRKTAKKDELILDINGTDLEQPIVSEINFTTRISPESIKVVLQESELGNTMLNALSYLLRGASSIEKFYKFERFWRAINGIYRLHAHSNNEFEGIKKLREFIILNQNLFPNTIAILNQYTSEDIRMFFRWRGLILNDFPTQKHAESFADFVKRYSDKRIMELLLETLPYRKEFLISANLYNDVLYHINNNISNNTINDGELVALISLKYTYYVRNKMFHGEIPESNFKLISNKEEDEIDKLNCILESLIIELVNNNDKL